MICYWLFRNCWFLYPHAASVDSPTNSFNSCSASIIGSNSFLWNSQSTLLRSSDVILSRRTLISSIGTRWSASTSFMVWFFTSLNESFASTWPMGFSSGAFVPLCLCAFEWCWTHIIKESGNLLHRDILRSISVLNSAAEFINGTFHLEYRDLNELWESVRAVISKY